MTRKPWMKAANFKWTSSGDMLAETAREHAKLVRSTTAYLQIPDRAIRAYAEALGVCEDDASARVRAQLDRLAEAPPLIVHPTGAPDRKAGMAVLARTRREIASRIGRTRSRISYESPARCEYEYAAALGVGLDAARDRIATQWAHLDATPAVVHFA